MIKRYPEYKDSGINWIKEIPEGWKVSQYKFEANVQNGFAFKSELFDKNEGFPILRIRDITNGQISTYYKGDFSDDYVISKGDLLVGMDGDYNIRWWNNGEALLNQRCCRIIEKKDVSRRFLYYSLPFNLKIINDLTYFTTVKHLSSGDILNAKFPRPTYSEQTKIAQYLDHQTGLIDAIIEKKQQLIEKLKEQRQAIINEAVTKGLDPDAPMKESGVEWLGEIPEHWEVKKMKYLSPVKRGASPRPIADPKYFDDGGDFGWVRIADVSASERYLERTTDQLSELGAGLSVKQFPGDFFLSIAGTVGKPIITKIKCCIHDGFVWFPELKINPEFLYYLFSNKLPFKGLGKLGTQLNLNTDTIGNIQIPCMPKEEMEGIVKYLDQTCNKLNEVIEKNITMIEKLQKYRQSIISEAVSGKIDVREWEPKIKETA